MLSLMRQAKVILSAQVHLILERQAELVHVKVLEESVLCVEVNLLDFLEGEDGQAVRRPVYCMSQE